LQNPRLTLREIGNFKIFSFYGYDEVKPIILRKHSMSGAFAYRAAANLSFKQFAREFKFSAEASLVPIDDKITSGYSHTAILAHAAKSEILRPTAKMVLVTAIANPARLSEHFSATIAQIFYPDHYDFTREELVKILTDFGATSLLVTQKDFVKIENFNLPVSLISLKTTLSPEFKALLNAEISV